MKLFRQLKKVVNFSNALQHESLDLSSFQNALSEQFFNLVNKTFDDRKNNAENSHYSKDQIDEIITKYTQKNMLIAATAAVVPGPLGMLSSGPEMVASIGNQMMMVYDIACACDKENFLNKDSLIDIPLHAFGGMTDLHQIQSHSLDLEDSPTDILKEKSTAFAKVMLQKLVKKSVTKWVPVGGSVMMSVWAKMSTKKIAQTAICFFDNQKTLSAALGANTLLDDQLLINRIKVLINMIDVDQEISEAELQFVVPIIENSTLDAALKNSLLEEVSSLDSDLSIDYSLFKESEEEKEQLLLEMAVMAKRSGSINDLEKNYLIEVARQVGMEETDAVFLLED